MTSSTRRPGVLVLESGAVYPGLLFGHEGHEPAYGEAVFNTSLTGYQEILTDPSYFGQIICMTAPHIGNTGVNAEDPESERVWCSGFVVHELEEVPASWRSTGDLESYLKRAKVRGLLGVDTRALTRRLRSEGTTRALILPADQQSLADRWFRELPGFEGRDLIREVTTARPYTFDAPEKTRFRVVAVDYGIKRGLLRGLQSRGCAVEVVPASMPAEDILARNPDGVFLSNGPGDPAAAPYAADVVRGLLGKTPLFGVCMGHQILSLALGAKTYKLKFGHRGGNQPVLDQRSGRVEVSSHNHGYAVDERSLPPRARVSHLNLNDRCVEGIELPQDRAFSVQYHPEACPGPHDSAILFDQFIELMQG